MTKTTRRSVRKRLEESQHPVFGRPINAFYIGSQPIADSIARSHDHEWTHPTLSSAVEAAVDKLNDDDDLELVTVVQIVRIVRRKKPIQPPIVVETVR